MPAKRIRRLLGVVALAVAGLAGPAAADPSVPPAAVPFPVDPSSQAGWWKPIDEFNGIPYVAFNAPGSTAATHTVYVARQETNGTWTRGCLHTTAGACAEFPDDIGHKTPTIAIDGHGYIHAFAGMHNTPWGYYRSSTVGGVTSMVDRSAEMPDQGVATTYPVATKAQNGDVYLFTRRVESGRLYRWNNAANTWSAVATFAADPSYVVYPDDIIGDPDGTLHIAWEWAYQSASGTRHLGSYLRYSPATNRFTNAAGAVLTIPVTIQSPIVYQPLEAGESSTDRGAGPAIQSAKLSLNQSTGRPMLAYRYRSVNEGPYRVRLAEWNGSAWQRQVVYAGEYDTYAAVDISTYGASGVRVYYAKKQTIADNQAFAATRQGNGTWQESLLLADVPVERLAVTRRGTTDHLYLASPTTGTLYYGRNPW